MTLAEFTLNGGNQQTFYDISLVDGYNLPMAIVSINPSSLPANKANPSCVATSGDFAPSSFNPYASGTFLGTTAQSPLPFDLTTDLATVSSWCPWDLQKFPPSTPKNGIYPYPDTNIVRPAFDPCSSACAKYGTAAYCCTGANDGPDKCRPNYYSSAAKGVCPDAYSFAYDDQSSTFITQQGPGFEIVFCPGGRSTRILADSSSSSSSPSSSTGQTSSAASSSLRSGGTLRRRGSTSPYPQPIPDALAGPRGGRALAATVAVGAWILLL